MYASIGAIIGLYGGMMCGILGWWFGRKKATNNWMFLLFSIPPNLIGLFTALTPNRKDTE
ncbi:hypothetical protein [Bacillus sp. FJAT-27251]|uniref:hypothetical protein n=1 Tax=Bacillus sp. FJAT-27251 TaxID=1684142 RepID=UPI0006A77CF8|nr:hypothetical protein [Bacillus sp. FJAT-27251]